MAGGEYDIKYVHWEDTGCFMRPSCLACDLPRCIEDMSLEERQRLPEYNPRRYRELHALPAVRQLRMDGLGWAQVADEVGVPMRTLKRWHSEGSSV